MTGVTSPFPTERLASRVARNFFTHSGQLPLTLLVLELLLAQPGYFAKPDPYLLIACGLFQAWLIEWLAARGQAQPFYANLAGPLVYSLAEAALEGTPFFLKWHHQAYWGFCLGFAILQSLQSRRATPNNVLVLAENILRSTIPLLMYAIFEVQASGGQQPFRVFFDDSAHRFLAIVLLMLGTLLGLADLNLRRSMITIHDMAARLRQYSEWTLGRDILDRAMADERSLALQRIHRAVVFMDIRGFTAWSEKQNPEIIVRMLNNYYMDAEAALGTHRPIKLKYTADEVMAVFADAPAALSAGRAMLGAVLPLLNAFGLGAGAGIHVGPVVEGVLGGKGTKAYDFIGDTVNTAKRLCDAAAPGELLASAELCAEAGLPAENCRAVAAKGKREPIAAVHIRP